MQKGDRANTAKSFYKPCLYELAWTSNGHLTPQAAAMITAFNHAGEKGLRPEDYNMSRLSDRAHNLEAVSGVPRELAQFDFDMTISVMRYASDLIYGRARPVGGLSGSAARRDQARVASRVWSELVVGADIPAAIQNMEPHAEGYLRTEKALSKLLDMLQRTPDISLPRLGHSLKPGDRSEAIKPLVARLQQLGELPAANAPDVYEGAVVDAVKHFQTTHGLAANGIVDAGVWRELSIPLTTRANQLAYTLERWRWIPHPLAPPPIVVNIPEFRLRAYNADGHAELSMAVIVGKAPYRKTPLLQAELTQVIFHPYWNVPKSIQVREIAPRVAKNPGYLQAHGYELLASNGAIIDGSDPSALAGIRSGKLRVRQIPGQQNALGYIKFVFPNGFGVYMHGTPQDSLFQSSRRDFSHGCIRVEDPDALAWWILRHEPGWTQQRIADSVANPRTYVWSLNTRIPVLLVYGTGTVAEDGTICFFNDIYGYDSRLKRELDGISRRRKAMDLAAAEWNQM